MNTFAMRAWAARAGHVGAAVVATAPVFAPAPTGSAQAGEHGTAAPDTRDDHDERVLASQHLRQIQALRRLQLTDGLDGKGEALLSELEQRRASLNAQHARDLYGQELDELAAMSQRLDDIHAALDANTKRRRKTGAQAKK